MLKRKFDDAFDEQHEEEEEEEEEGPRDVSERRGYQLVIHPQHSEAGIGKEQEVLIVPSIPRLFHAVIEAALRFAPTIVASDLDLVPSQLLRTVAEHGVRSTRSLWSLPKITLASGGTYIVTACRQQHRELLYGRKGDGTLHGLLFDLGLCPLFVDAYVISHFHSETLRPLWHGERKCTCTALPAVVISPTPSLCAMQELTSSLLRLPPQALKRQKTDHVWQAEDQPSESKMEAQKLQQQLQAETALCDMWKQRCLFAEQQCAEWQQRFQNQLQYNTQLASDLTGCVKTVQNIQCLLQQQKQVSV